jgi:hypothetical protein
LGQETLADVVVFEDIGFHENFFLGRLDGCMDRRHRGRAFVVNFNPVAMVNGTGVDAVDESDEFVTAHALGPYVEPADLLSAQFAGQAPFHQRM